MGVADCGFVDLSDLGVCKRQSSLDVPGLYAGHSLPTTNGDIDVERIEFDDPSNSPGPLCREDRRAAAAEGVEDDAVSPAAISDQVGETARFSASVKPAMVIVGTSVIPSLLAASSRQ
jgi:hypothetical protein